MAATGRQPDPSNSGGSTVQPLVAPSIAHLELDDRLRFVLDRMVEVVRADAGAVFLPDAETGDLEPRALVGIEPSALEGLRCRVGTGFLGLVAQGSSPAVMQNVQRDSDPANAHLRERDVQTAVGLPLSAGGGVLGVAAVEFLRPRKLQSYEVRRLATIADHLAAVVDSTRLYEESRTRNAELQRKHAELLELERLKADFLSMISHELRTPLTAIIGYTDLLLREVHGRLNERQRQHELAVRKAARRLLELISNLLDVTRLESGQVELSIEPTPLAEACWAVVDDLQAAAEAAHVRLSVDLPAGLPPVLADGQRLRQILFNLLDNALKFTQSRGQVKLRAEAQGGTVCVSISDTGSGVPADQLDRIWDRLHQADSSARRRFGGTGLGLAIVRNLVQLQGGTVEAVSLGPAQGSTFSFKLPVAAPVVAGFPSPREAHLFSPKSTVPSMPIGLRRVLVVDDEPDNREVIASVVTELLGHVALLAEDGERALELAHESPDLVLLDLKLPGLSGFEVARRLKADPQTAHIPIVAISALAERDDQQAALAAGCVECVTKPFTPAALIDAIDHVLGPESATASASRR
ncbi:MAG TPA: ATP-binding protein [Chloroflexota bacterium]|nr:ATP-binding protein [Chloroflexota bacterium]